jgi:hypothetical protein
VFARHGSIPFEEGGSASGRSHHRQMPRAGGDNRHATPTFATGNKQFARGTGFATLGTTPAKMYSAAGIKPGPPADASVLVCDQHVRGLSGLGPGSSRGLRTRSVEIRTSAAPRGIATLPLP